MTGQGIGAERRARLAAARLYLVCPAIGDRKAMGGRELPDLLRAAVAGGVDVVQIREKHLADDELAAVAHAARALCERLGALLIVNDRPLVAREVGADGVHVGQDDMPPAQVREIVGREMLIGLSTHTRHEIDAVSADRVDEMFPEAPGAPPSGETSLDAPERERGDETATACAVDYIGVGPVHETPTKPGRPAVGVELVRHAAAHAQVPFFAIGGLDEGNLPEVIAAGARRAVVLRAIAGTEDPERAARGLREMLDGRPLEV